MANLTSSQVMSPRTTTSRKLTSLTESLTQPQFSEQRFLEEVDRDDTAIEEIFHNTHRVTSEKACLSVSRRRPCPKER